MNIETLKEKKDSLLNEVNDLVAKKNELYSSVNIESPKKLKKKN
jgi:FtsZ-binding cell division protein ZapB